MIVNRMGEGMIVDCVCSTYTPRQTGTGIAHTIGIRAEDYGVLAFVTLRRCITPFSLHSPTQHKCAAIYGCPPVYDDRMMNDDVYDRMNE